MLNKIKNNLIDIYIILNIIILFIFSYIRTISIIKYQTYGLTIEILAIINIIISIALIIIKKIKFKNFKINITDILLLLMFLFGLISTIYAYDIKTAIHGASNRYEGLLAITYYLTLTFLGSFAKNKKLIINIILCNGIIQTICSICQVYRIFAGTSYLYNRYQFASGFVYNSNFYGSFVLMCLLYSIGLYYDEKNKINKILYLIIINLFTIGLLLSSAASCAIGLIITFIYILFYSIKKKEYKKILCLIVIIIFNTLLFTALAKTTFIRDLVRTKEQTVEIAKGNVDDSFGTSRIAIWKQTLKYVPENLLNGIGIDNFKMLNNGNGIFVNGELHSKAHNEYLQILITQGIFCLITYLFFYSYIVFKRIKNSLKNNNIYLIIPIIGYLIQAFFNISVIDVAPIFWIGIGLSIERNEKKYQ